MKKKAYKVFAVLTKILVAIIIAIFLLSILLLLYCVKPLHVENPHGNTDYVWQANSYWVQMTEGIALGRYDALGFNNLAVVENPDILVLGSSHMEAVNVMQTENAAYLLDKMLSGRLSVYNLGISGHDFYKICQYLPATLKLYNPKIVVLETSTVDISKKNVDNILQKKVNYTQSHNNGLIGALQRITFFRLLYFQSQKGLMKIFLPQKKVQKKIDEEPTRIDEHPYEELNSYLHSIEQKYGVEIIIAYHPTGELQKDGTILFKPSEQKKLFKRISAENGITFIDLTTDFEKMYYDEHHVAHGFVTGKLESGHLNKYGHAAMAKALYKSISGMEKDGLLCK